MASKKVETKKMRTVHAPLQAVRNLKRGTSRESWKKSPRRVVANGPSRADTAIRKRIERALRVAYDNRTRVDIGFHMTDWLDDLRALFRICDEPMGATDAEIRAVLGSFLSHVPEHLAAAAKLYTGFPVADIFGVGAVEENGRKESRIEKSIGS